jgi:hypothetical protein
MPFQAIRLAILLCISPLVVFYIHGVEAGAGLQLKPPSISVQAWRPRVSQGLNPTNIPHVKSLPFDFTSDLGLWADYYLTSPFMNWSGEGLRLTTGIWWNPQQNSPTLSPHRISPDAMQKLGNSTYLNKSILTSALPYFGIGYTYSPSRIGWWFSADLGLIRLDTTMPNYLGSPSLSRPYNSGLNIEDMLRQLRLSPLLQVHVSYSF